MYVNGVEENFIDGTLSLAVTRPVQGAAPAAFEIGGGSGDEFRGQLDDFMVFIGTVVSPEEIFTLAVTGTYTDWAADVTM